MVLRMIGDVVHSKHESNKHKTKYARSLPLEWLSAD